jgi:hypothetical protein
MQISGREEVYSLICISPGLLGAIGQQWWNQGVNLYSIYSH